MYGLRRNEAESGGSRGRGFAGMDKRKQHQIAQKGGEASKRSLSHEDRVRLGKKGAASRWGRNYGNQNDNEDYSEEEEDIGSEEEQQQGNSGRSGRRGGRGRGSGSGSSGRGFAGMDSRLQHQIAQKGGEASKRALSHEDRVHLGKMGAAARWGRNYEDDNENEDEDEDIGSEEEEDNQGNSGRSRGVRGSRSGRGSSGGQRGGAGNFQNLSHDELVKLGKRGASARWGRNYEDDNESEQDNEDEDMGSEQDDDDQGFGGNNRRSSGRGSGRRGFAAMPPAKRRAIASLGGRSRRGSSNSQ